MQISFKNTGHYFAVAGRAVINAARFVARIKPEVEAAEPYVEAASAMVGAPPSVVDLEKAAFGAYGHVADAINAGAKPNADGSLNVGAVAPEIVAAVKSTMGVVDAFATVQGMPKPAAASAK